MGAPFWIRRAATVFALIAAVLFAVSLLKGRGIVGGAQFSIVWAAASTVVFIAARLVQSRRGQHCEVCQDIPAPDSETTVLPRRTASQLPSDAAEGAPSHRLDSA